MSEQATTTTSKTRSKSVVEDVALGSEEWQAALDQGYYGELPEDNDDHTVSGVIAAAGKKK
jgi:hypothetical protein